MFFNKRCDAGSMNRGDMYDDIDITQKYVNN